MNSSFQISKTMRSSGLLSFARTFSLNFFCAFTFYVDRILPFPDTQDEEISNYPQGLILIPRGNAEGSVVVGPHIRGSRLRAIDDEEVDLLLPGTARYLFSTFLSKIKED